MNLNYCVKRILAVGWMVNTCFVSDCLCGCVFLETNAIAAPTTLIAANVGDQIQGTADEVRVRSKDLIRDTKIKLKTANKNAAKVDQADDKVASLSAKHSVIR